MMHVHTLLVGVARVCLPGSDYVHPACVWRLGLAPHLSPAHRISRPTVSHLIHHAACNPVMITISQ